MVTQDVSNQEKSNRYSGLTWSRWKQEQEESCSMQERTRETLGVGGIQRPHIVGTSGSHKSDPSKSPGNRGYLGLGHQPSHKTFSLQSACMQDVLEQQRHRTCGSGQPMTGTTCGPHHDREPSSDNAHMTRNQRMANPESQERTKQKW